MKVGVLLVEGDCHGEVLYDFPSSLSHTRGHDAELQGVCEGYGPMDRVGIDDPARAWPTHVRDTEVAQVSVAFANDSPYMGALQLLAAGKSIEGGIPEGQPEAIMAAFEKWKGKV